MYIYIYIYVFMYLYIYINNTRVQQGILDKNLEVIKDGLAKAMDAKVR